MANKIDNAITAIVAALGALKTAGSLKAIERRPVNPSGYHGPTPVLSVVLGPFRRRGTTWEAEVSLALLATVKGDVSDELAVELAAQVNDVVEALATASGAVPGTLDSPQWDAWYHEPLGYARVGAVGSIRLTVENPLKITE